MTWQDVGQFVSKAAPLLGGALAGNAGELAGQLLAKTLGVDPAPDKVLSALQNSPDAIVKLKEIESNERVKIAEINAAADTAENGEVTKQIQAVNQTMQVETANASTQDWYQKAWRPACGFAVAGGSLLSIAFVCCLFYTALTSQSLGMNVVTVVNVLPVFAASVAAILAIPGTAVGISAYQRGKMQREQAKAGDA